MLHVLQFEISTLYVFGIYYTGEDKKRVNYDFVALNSLDAGYKSKELTLRGRERGGGVTYSFIRIYRP